MCVLRAGKGLQCLHNPLRTTQGIVTGVHKKPCASTFLSTLHLPGIGTVLPYPCAVKTCHVLFYYQKSCNQTIRN